MRFRNIKKCALWSGRGRLCSTLS